MLDWVIIALAIGVGIDWAFGDPPNRYHPVAWLGRLIGWAFLRARGRGEKLRGAVIAWAIVLSMAAVAYLLSIESLEVAGTVGLIVMSALLLKSTIAVRGMEVHARAIISAIDSGDVRQARKSLSLIVRRDTEGLDEQHVLSATIECIGESTVDGIAGPIFYYSLFGPGGAFAYRAINTLDSMVGYREAQYKDIGWMSARLDTAANYLPARLTAILMVLSARILGADWKGSLRILRRDHVNTESPNAGYPMATMAGALRVRLEKIGYYALGDPSELASVEKCRAAISIMKMTTVLLCTLYSVPVIVSLYFMGWWRLLLGVH